MISIKVCKKHCMNVSKWFTELYINLKSKYQTQRVVHQSDTVSQIKMLHAVNRSQTYTFINKFSTINDRRISGNIML